MKTYGKKVKLTVLILLISLFIPLFSSLSFDVSAKNEKNGYDFTGIYLTREKISVKAGGSYTLSTREIGISKGEVKWSSENEEIASVTPDGEVI